MGSNVGVPFLSLCQESLSAAGGRVELERGDNKAQSQSSDRAGTGLLQEYGDCRKWGLERNCGGCAEMGAQPVQLEKSWLGG